MGDGDELGEFNIVVFAPDFPVAFNNDCCVDQCTVLIGGLIEVEGVRKERCQLGTLKGNRGRATNAKVRKNNNMGDVGFRTYHVEEETTAADWECRNSHDVSVVVERKEAEDFGC